MDRYLGKALINHLKGKRDKIQIVACFDVMPEKIRKQHCEIKCYHINELENIIEKENIKIALLTLPDSETIPVVKRLIMAGIKGILNFTSTPLNLPSYVYVEKYDIVTALEKVAYFAKHNNNEE
jgi:redox-sensing transcriptional repressor